MQPSGLDGPTVAALPLPPNAGATYTPRMRALGASFAGVVW
jgi:hypothetical protein